jgi:hypothetical protein
MSEPLSSNEIGEQFAFFRWVSDVEIPQGMCRLDPIIGEGAGWTCLYCRQDWFKLQGRNWRLA